MIAQGALHLSKLDSVAAYLDLRVHPSKEFNVAIRLPPSQVARAVEPLTALRRDESFVGLLRVAQIAEGKPDAANAQLSDYTHRD